MKYCLITLFACIFALNSCKEQKKEDVITPKIDSASVVTKSETSNLDQSPLDIIYYPLNYPLLKMKGDAAKLPVARIIYSRPHKKGRVIFGESTSSLCPYGVEWRLGANEATEIEFFKNVTINKRLIPAGRYILYCVPYESYWKMIFNTNLYSWGLHIDKNMDIFSTDIPIENLDTEVENFTINFEPSKNGANIIMEWDKVKTVLPVEFKN
ncbi:MAG: DUF2911 domain-containing protein [Ferruginibacter sp.]